LDGTGKNRLFIGLFMKVRSKWKLLKNLPLLLPFDRPVLSEPSPFDKLRTNGESTSSG
jgi:hypothetical protein